jgi:N-acetylmuramoyl-L-alanine amidase
VEAYAVVLLGICVWREARGESPEAQAGVAWSIMNRASKPSWWGHDVVSCILMPAQYSSFNKNDPNSTKFPLETDTAFIAIMNMIENIPVDPTGGATSYYDSSMDSAPPYWAKSMTMVSKIGNLRFLK